MQSELPEDLEDNFEDTGAMRLSFNLSPERLISPLNMPTFEKAFCSSGCRILRTVNRSFLESVTARTENQLGPALSDASDPQELALSDILDLLLETNGKQRHNAEKNVPSISFSSNAGEPCTLGIASDVDISAPGVRWRLGNRGISRLLLRPFEEKASRALGVRGGEDISIPMKPAAFQFFTI